MKIDWKDKKVLICGGAGLIGSHMARRLVKYGSQVTVADNMSSGSLKNLRGIECVVMNTDLRDKKVCKQLARGHDYIFQFAANMGGIGYITSIGADIMLDSAECNLNMLRAYLSSNNAKGFFYSSSACVYPEYRQTETEVVPLKEEHAYPAEPDQFYGWEKLFTEKVCESINRDYGTEKLISSSQGGGKIFDMGIRVARFHNVFGPIYTAFDKQKGKAPCHLIYKVLTCEDGGEIEIWGDGKATRSFLYIDDCIDGVLKLMESDYIYPVNIGSDRMIAINDLAQMVIDISGKRVTMRHDLSKPQGVRGRNSDNTLVNAVLGWQPRKTLEYGMERTYRWAEAHLEELEL